MLEVQTERVLVVPTALFHELGYFQGFSTDVDRYLGRLFSSAHASYRPRAEVEEDPSFKQLIPYCIFRHHDAARGETVFHKDFVAITEGGARWLVDHGIRLVGVDYLSVAPFGLSTPTHRVLLEAGIVLVEGLNLSQVPRGFYDLYCLPLKVGGCDGAPARAILVG